MTLCRVQVTDFRCLHRAALELDSRLTVVSGPNASGKTSVLEAIYLLGRGRSFRTRKTASLIRDGAQRLIVYGDLESKGRHLGLGVEASAEGMSGRLAGQRLQSRSTLALTVPVQVIDPEVHRLIEDGPVQRRQFLDWGVFHVEPQFASRWQQFHQALRQRNAALRKGLAPEVVSAWDGELTRYADWLTAARAQYVERLAPPAAIAARRLAGVHLELGYRSGWLRDLNFAEALRRSWTRDQHTGSTQVGPQRAELSLMIDGEPARERLSRGQQKLLAAALVLAQIQLFESDTGASPLLLLDDPAAELDTEHFEALIREVRSEPMQLVVTTLAGGDVEALGTPGRRYRLAEGAVFEA